MNQPAIDNLLEARAVLQRRVLELEAENAALRAKLNRKGTGRKPLGAVPLTNAEQQRRKRARAKARAAGLPDPFAE